VTTDADEAVVLADTVLVMSHLPMRVLERIDIDLPRPRRIIDVASDDRANAMRRRIIDLMRDEVVRSFGERMLES
jgi:NitT/TauT family transport system ATP-binding protein